MASNVKDTVIKILAEQALLTPKDISENSNLESLGIDSLGLVEIIFSIEEAFNITTPFNANDPENASFDISNVKSIVNAVEQIISKSAKRNNS